MPLGSAPTSTIDIDFTRAQGVNSTGRILFEPPRISAGGTTMLSTRAVSVEIEEGVGSVELARLSAGFYHVTEEIDGRPPYEWDFALPLNAAEVIQYEAIAAVSPVPATYTTVRTVNNVAPDPMTGNVVVEAGGGAPDPHTHVAADITDFNASVDARISFVVDNAPAALNTLNELAAALGDDPNFAGSITVALGGKAATVHAHVIGDITNLQAVLDAKAALAHTHTIGNVTGLQTSLDGKQRIITTRSQYFTPGDINPLPNTGSSWAPLSVELSIPAAVGDRVRVGVHGMRNTSANVYLDMAVVTGSGPSVIKRYMATGNALPALEGDPGWYLSNGFINQSAPRQFVVTADDRDGSNVRLAVACKSNGSGILYASASYPLYILLENIGPEPA